MSRKKNKKSFSDNLEILFQERMLDDNAQDNLSMIESDKDSNKKGNKGKGGATATKTNKAGTSSKKTKKGKTTRKSFSTNLEQFFKDSISGVLDGVVTEGVITGVKRNMVGKGKKRAIGLDLLIKRTTDENVKDKSTHSKSTATKRVTVLLDTEKLEELKRIAKLEKRRLHQIIDELVSEYIETKDD